MQYCLLLALHYVHECLICPCRRSPWMGGWMYRRPFLCIEGRQVSPRQQCTLKRGLKHTWDNTRKNKEKTNSTQASVVVIVEKIKWMPVIRETISVSLCNQCMPRHHDAPQYPCPNQQSLNSRPHSPYVIALLYPRTMQEKCDDESFLTGQCSVLSHAHVQQRKA